jgi:hypothetical protein
MWRIFALPGGYSLGAFPTEEGGQWTMENQVSPGPGSRLQVVHWAYMYQSRPQDPGWDSLPGVDESVEEFMAACLAG